MEVLLLLGTGMFWPFTFTVVPVVFLAVPPGGGSVPVAEVAGSRVGSAGVTASAARPAGALPVVFWLPTTNAAIMAHKNAPASIKLTRLRERSKLTWLVPSVVGR